jgi:hypothetical protein
MLAPAVIAGKSTFLSGDFEPEGGAKIKFKAAIRIELYGSIESRALQVRCEFATESIFASA